VFSDFQGGVKMGKDLTFDELTHLIGATVISCDFDRTQLKNMWSRNMTAKTAVSL
jgi:hypothetical protein